MSTTGNLLRAALACAILVSPAGAQRPLKVYISVDMEGVGGVVTNEQLGPPGFEYQRARQFMTDEALAAIQGARDAGATEILITEAYKIAFQQYRYGYAAAYSTVIFLILLAYGIWQNRATHATEGI